MYTRHELKCGATLYMTPLPVNRSASIGFWVKTGSINEDKAQNGISHFIEHMLFKGTRHRSAKDIAEFFDARGGDLNAFTSKECTCYHAKVLDHHLLDAIEVMSDMISHPLFDEEEIEKEKNVVIDEIKMAEDTSDDVSYDLIAKASFGQGSLGQPILGYETQVTSFSKTMLFDYMAKYYTSDRLVISLAGSFDAEAVIDKLNTYLDIIEASEQPEDKVQSFVHHNKFIHKDMEQVHLELAYPGLALGDPRVFPMAALNAVLGGSVSSRLFQNIREKHGLTYSVNSFTNQHESIGTLSIYANMHKDNLYRVVDLISQDLRLLIEGGITPEELRRVKEQLKGSYILELEGSESYMGLIGKNRLFHKRVHSLEEIEEKINAISLEDIQEVIALTLQKLPALSLVGRVDQDDLDYCARILGECHE